MLAFLCTNLDYKPQSINPSPTSLHLTTISFPQISRSQCFSPPPLPTFHLPPLLTFHLPTINLPTLFINLLLSKIPPPNPTSFYCTSPPPTTFHLPLLFIIFCSVNSSSNPTLFTIQHIPLTRNSPYNISPKPSIFDLYSSPFSFPKFLILYSQNHSYVISCIIQLILVSCILSSLTLKYSIIYNTYL